MSFIEFILIVFTAILIAVLFYYVFESKGPWNTFWSFFLVLSLVGLAAEVWIGPIGPVVFDVTWLPTVFVIIIFALLLGAASPTRSKTTLNKPRKELSEEEKTSIALGGFFWLLLLFLLGIIIWGVIDGHPLTNNL